MSHFRKRTPGEPFNPSASEYNAFIDASLAHKSNSLGGGGGAAREAHPERLEVNAVAPDDVTAYSCVVISGVVTEPAQGTDPQTGLSRICIDTTAATDSTGTDESFAIFLRGAKSGTVAPVCIGGLTAARLDVTEETHKYAKPRDGNSLESTAEPTSIRIVWNPGEGENKVGIVLIGAATASGSSAQLFRIDSTIGARSDLDLGSGDALRCTIEDGTITATEETETIYNSFDVAILPYVAPDDPPPDFACNPLIDEGHLYATTIEIEGHKIIQSVLYRRATEGVTLLSGIEQTAAGIEVHPVRVFAPFSTCEPTLAIPVYNCDS